MKIQLIYENNPSVKSYELYYDKLIKNRPDVFTRDNSEICMITMGDDCLPDDKKIIFRTPHITKQNLDFIKFAMAYSDYLIFQSNFMLQVYTNYFGRMTKPYAVIYNAVEKTVDCAQNDKILICGDFIQHPDRLPFETNKVATLEQTLEWIAGKYDVTLAGTIPNSLRVPAGIDVIWSSDFIDLDELRKTHGIYLHTTLFDNCPNTLLESMISGMACIGYQSGSVPELLPDYTCTLFDKFYINNLIEDVIDEIDTFRFNRPEKLFMINGFSDYYDEIKFLIEDNQ